MKVELIELTSKVFKYYKTRVDGNKRITYDQARRKLSRNLEMAQRVEPRNEEDVQKGNVMWQYGNLHMVTRNGYIVHIRNYKNTNAYSDWKFDPYKYVELSEKYGIAK
jgi:hypothetical protein